MRKQFIINPEFQSKFILKFCIVVAFASLLICAFVVWFSDGSTTVTIENARVNVKNTADFIYPILLQSFVVGLVFSALSVGFMTMFMTHKIAGPLFRMKRNLKKIQTGDFSEDFRVRSDDQLGDFCEEMQVTFQAIKNVSLETKNLLKQYKESENLEEKKDLFEKITEKMSFFKD